MKKNYNSHPIEVLNLLINPASEESGIIYFLIN